MAWLDRSERRIMSDGLVFTVEPFLSLGAEWAENGDDDPPRRLPFSTSTRLSQPEMDL